MPKTINILIVDDEEGIRSGLAMYIEDEGHKVFVAASGNEAIEICNKNKIDFVISDIRMPDGDGIKLLKSLRSKNPDLPVVLMMSGFSQYSRETIISKGAIDLIEKPFPFEKLEEYIDQYLESH